MHFLDRTLPTLEENLALDEALLLQAEQHSLEVLRLWEWPGEAVVLGAGGRLLQEVHLDRCQHDRVPVLRRSSGGGTVLLGPGCLLFSLIVPYRRHPALADLHASYRYLLEPICRGLESFHQPIRQAGISDLVWGEKKFSGNAQQRKRHHLLHHGTLLYAFDLTRLEVYLKHPPRMPEYRLDRPHLEFVTNLSVSRADLSARLRETWQATQPLETIPDLKELLEEKYRSLQWHQRR